MVAVGDCGVNDDSKDEIVVDFRGNPVDKSRTGGWLAAGFILGSELAERVCIMGISMNLVTYLVGDLHISTSKSANIVTNFMGTLNLLALFAGFLADAKLGRYRTIAIFGTITALGASLLALATTIPSMRPPACEDYRQLHHKCNAATGNQLALLYAALYTIALGAGGIKSNVSGFGSDQFDIKDPKEEKSMTFFFNRFYLFISFGSLFSVTVLVYVQDNVGRGWGYGISAAIMAFAVGVLLIGSQYYRFKKPNGSPLTEIFRVLFLAWKKRKIDYPDRPCLLYEFEIAKVPRTEKFRCLDKAAIFPVSGNIDKWTVSTLTEVEEVKMVIKLLPIWSTCILFWTTYSQMTTVSVEQATYMDRKIGKFIIPSGSLCFFLFLTIIVFTSLNEKILVPIARKFTKNASGLTSLQRVGIGLVFSIVAMIVSAIVEKQRREFSLQKNTKINAFWLVPQFFLVGAGEAFAYVGQLEFFIREAPDKMKSMSTALLLTTLSMGFFMSSLLVSMVDKVTDNAWIKDNLNKGRLDDFYWLLAILSLLNFIVFLAFSNKHEYKVQHVKEEDVEIQKNPLDRENKVNDKKNEVLVVIEKDCI